jgi:hypothetical protein
MSELMRGRTSVELAIGIEESLPTQSQNAAAAAR